MASNLRGVFIRFRMYFPISLMTYGATKVTHCRWCHKTVSPELRSWSEPSNLQHFRQMQTCRIDYLVTRIAFICIHIRGTYIWYRVAQLWERKYIFRKIQVNQKVCILQVIWEFLIMIWMETVNSVTLKSILIPNHLPVANTKWNNIASANSKIIVESVTHSKNSCMTIRFLRMNEWRCVVHHLTHLYINTDGEFNCLHLFLFL